LTYCNVPTALQHSITNIMGVQDVLGTGIEQICSLMIRIMFGRE